MVAYINDFKLLMILTIAVMPLVMLIGTTKKTSGVKPTEAVAHAID
jgi:hypothetical protein